MRQKNDLQKLFLKYGELTCLNLINLSYKKRFYSSMATARSEISAKQCEILIKKSLNYVKKLDLEERIYKSHKNGSFNVYTLLDNAVEELGETLILDLLNQNLRYRIEIGEDVFSISSLGERELEILKKEYDEEILKELWDGKRSRGKGKKTLEKEARGEKVNIKRSSIGRFMHNENAFLPTRELTPVQKKDEDWQNDCRVKQQAREDAEREKEWEEKEKEKRGMCVKRSLDEDPDYDQPKIFILETLNEKKLKHVEVKHDKDEDKNNE